VDKRTDIWAFGCVLFEMLSGRPAFEGGTLSDILAKVLEHDPDWNALPQATPPIIERVLRRCLDKDSKQRLRDIGDARVEIGADPLAWTRAQRVSTNRPRGLALAAATAGAVLAVVLALAWSTTPSRRPAVVRVTQLEVAPPVGSEFQPDRGVAISPDG